MLSVLAVGDYEPSLYAQARALRAVGYRVLQARDGRTALDLAMREHPDILLLDVHLPDLHGFEICQQLKADARTAHIPVIHISATGRGDRYRRESAAAGAFAYLQEPGAPRGSVAGDAPGPGGLESACAPSRSGCASGPPTSKRGRCSSRPAPASPSGPPGRPGRACAGARAELPVRLPLAPAHVLA